MGVDYFNGVCLKGPLEEGVVFINAGLVLNKNFALASGKVKVLLLGKFLA